jgi:hypothetical protein
MRDRHRLSKFVLRQDRRMPIQSWGVKRRKWLGDQHFDHPAQEQAFQSYLHALDFVDRRVEVLERQIDALAVEGPWALLVARGCGACAGSTP